MSSLMLETALRLASAGLAVHWLHARSKVPICDGYQFRPWTSTDELRRQFWGYLQRRGAECNLGLHTGRVAGARFATVALDVDSEPARRWADEHVPPSPIRNLSPNGEHRLYRHPGGVIRNRVKVRVDGERIDIDLRGDGGNLAIAPSLHPSGLRYRWPEPWTPETLATMPLWDPSWIPAEPARELSPSRSAARDELALMERGRRLALRWQVSERGQGQGTDTFKLAGYLVHRIGLSEPAAFTVLWNYYNGRCPEPYSEQLLRRKVEQAATQIRSTNIKGGRS